MKQKKLNRKVLAQCIRRHALENALVVADNTTAEEMRHALGLDTATTEEIEAAFESAKIKLKKLLEF